MERFLEIINKGIEMGATDIHLLEGSKPLYRVKRALITNYEVEPMTKYEMVTLLEAMVGDNEALIEKFEQTKRIDIPYDVNEGIRLRINVSLSSGTPTFSIRVIRTTNIDIDAYRLREILQEIKKHKTGLVLITGKVNSGKTTTLNAFVQDINKIFTKKIVMLEEPVEYIHKSNRSFIVQKEVGVESDVPSYYEGVINLLREDSDIAIVGEIRDRETMDAVIDLAEAGGLVIGTLHTRSCGETIDRIIGMYEPSEHRAIKNTLSNVLKLVVSQRLVNATDGNIVLVPEIMTVNTTIAALIRQERFNISEIQDAIHHSNGSNLVSFERSFTKLYKEHIIDLETIEQSVEPDSFKLITNLIGGRILMPEYKYRGMLRNGKIVRGVMIAKNRHSLLKSLKESRIQPIEVKAMREKLISESKKKIDHSKLDKIQKDLEKQRIAGIKKKTEISKKQSTASKLGLEINLKMPKPKDILVMTNSMYVLKKAKFNNIATLESLYNSTQNKKLKETIENILIGVEGGASIHEMMAQYPKIFPPLYINFIRVGENSGSLDVALLHARDYMESEINLKKQIKGILLPKLLMFIGIWIAMIAALLYGVPLIQNVYDMFGVQKELPPATMWALNLSKAILKYWYIVAILVAAIYAIFKVYLSTAIGRYEWDKMKIKLPVIGTLNLNIIASKFFKAMLLNLRNGQRIQESLESAKSVTTNYYFLSLIETGKNQLQAGGSWIDPFEADKAFPVMAIEMLKIGMQSDLVEMMDKVEEYVRQEIDESIQKTIKVLPDVTYVFVGIVLIFFVIVVMVPLMDVYMGGFLLEGM